MRPSHRQHPLLIPSRVTGEPASRCGVDVLVDVLGFDVLHESRGAKLSAETGLFESTPLGLRQVRVIVVDPDRAVAQRAGDTLGPAGVLRPHRASEPVHRVVADANGFVFRGERLDGHHRPKGLVLHTPHR